jgi:predicted DNA-binding transcriptional regulator AlpA
MAESTPGQRTFGWTAASPGESMPEQTEAPGSRARRTRRRQVETLASDARPGEGELPPDNELWDVHAAARFLKRSVSWVYHKAEDGTLPVRRLGGWGIRFIPAELRAWVESGGGGRSGR